MSYVILRRFRNGKWYERRVCSSRFDPHGCRRISKKIYKAADNCRRCDKCHGMNFYFSCTGRMTGPITVGDEYMRYTFENYLGYIYNKILCMECEKKTPDYMCLDHCL